MRLLATRTPEWRMREAVKRFLLVAGIEDWRYQGLALVYAYVIEEDGPSATGWLYEDAERAMADLEEEWGVPRACWRSIPDQMPGCQLDWIAPVRIKRSEEGTPMQGAWERWVDGKWVEIGGPTA